MYNYSVKRNGLLWYSRPPSDYVKCEKTQPCNYFYQFEMGLSIKMEQEVIKREQKKIIFSCKDVKMRIALCDRNKSFLKQIKNMIYKYAEAKRLDIVVDCYLSGEDMISSGESYNVFILGYGLMGANGLEIAKQLRCDNELSFIIFISDYTDFVFEAFKVRPYRFLVRPVSEQQLFIVLDELFNDYGKSYPIWLKCGEDIVCLSTYQIVYLEADNKHCLVHLENECLRANRTMACVYEKLPKYCFIKINRAFIVNADYIFKYNSDCVVLKNGESLHISRNYFKSFKEEYKEMRNPHLP